MKLINDIYKTKNLAYYGRFISICIIGLITIGPFVIPEFVPSSKEQLFSINGKHIKYDDDKIVSDFFNSIKVNNGFLCLGTSESGSISGSGNYFNYLNDDPDLKPRFSILGGAGRTCGKYIPLFLNHQEDVKSLNIIYLINPVYWRDDLAQYSNDYWSRYSNYSVIKNTSASEIQNEKYLQPANDYANGLNISQKITFESEFWLRELRLNYFQNLNYLINPDKYYREQNYVSPKNDLSIYNNFGKIDFEHIDTVLNVTKDHSVTHLFQPMNNTSDYRTRELESFIQLCKDLDINITYVLGPINRRFIHNKFPNELDKYNNTSNHIQSILEENGVEYINATDLSDKPGAFKDPLHHSSYGAYLLYLKIKNYFDEK